LPIGVFATSPDGRLTEANDAFRALVLGGGPIAVGTAPWANAQPAERAAGEIAWQRSIQEGASFSFEFRVWRPDGEAIWIHVATQPVLDAAGVVTGFVGTALDVTESVARRALSERLVGLLDSSADAVLVFDPRGDLLFCNDGARSLVGVDERSTMHDATTQLFIRAILDQVPREIT
jgi:PAS domain S-box-containing protein